MHNFKNIYLHIFKIMSLAVSIKIAVKIGRRSDVSILNAVAKQRLKDVTFTFKGDFWSP